MLSIYQKAKRKKVIFLMVWYCIVSYRYHFVSTGIVSYRKKIYKVHIPTCYMYGIGQGLIFIIRVGKTVFTHHSQIDYINTQEQYSYSTIMINGRRNKACNILFK